MQNKKLLIIVGSIILVIIVAAVLILLLSKKAPVAPVATGTPTVNTQTSAPNPSTLQNGDKVIFQTTKGDVSVNNIFKGKQINTSGQIQPIILSQNSFYQVSYSYDGNFFGISMLKTPVKQYRTAAEEALLNALGISNTDACKLPVSVTVPLSVDPLNGGNVNYGLSFCANGIQMQ